MLCVSSIHSGNLQLKIKASMQPLNTRTGIGSVGTSEIQQITIGGNVMDEHQVI